MKKVFMFMYVLLMFQMKDCSASIDVSGVSNKIELGSAIAMLPAIVARNSFSNVESGRYKVASVVIDVVRLVNGVSTLYNKPSNNLGFRFHKYTMFWILIDSAKLACDILPESAVEYFDRLLPDSLPRAMGEKIIKKLDSDRGTFKDLLGSFLIPLLEASIAVGLCSTDLNSSVSFQWMTMGIKGLARSLNEIFDAKSIGIKRFFTGIFVLHLISFVNDLMSSKSVLDEMERVARASRIRAAREEIAENNRRAREVERELANGAIDGASNHQANNQICSVCQENVEAQDSDAVHTGCFHLFHRNCLQQALQADVSHQVYDRERNCMVLMNGHRCPNCRETLDLNDFSLVNRRIPVQELGQESQAAVAVTEDDGL